MVWAKVDDRFPQHPKVVGLDPAAVGVWLMCLCDARARGDSAVPAKLPERYAPGRGAELAAALESCGLWERTETGWLIHDSATYLPPANLSAKRSQAGSKGAATRWQTDGKATAKAWLRVSRTRTCTRDRTYCIYRCSLSFSRWYFSNPTSGRTRGR